MKQQQLFIFTQYPLRVYRVVCDSTPQGTLLQRNMYYDLVIDRKFEKLHKCMQNRKQYARYYDATVSTIYK